MLITHRGLSGPAILQISSYWSDGRTDQIDLAPDVMSTAEIRERQGPRFGGGAVRVTTIFAETVCNSVAGIACTV